MVLSSTRSWSAMSSASLWKAACPLAPRSPYLAIPEAQGGQTPQTPAKNRMKLASEGRCPGNHGHQPPGVPKLRSPGP